MSSGENNAVQENVSREDLFKEFRTLLERVRNKDTKNKYVINYHGERGSGKSWFVGELRREARGKGCTVLELDFSSGKLEPEDALERLMRDLEEKKINFKNCGEGMRKLGRNWDVKLPLRRAATVVILVLIFAAAVGFLEYEYDKSINLWLSIFSVIIGAFGFALLQSKIYQWSLKGEQKEIQSKLKDEYKDLDLKEKEDWRERLPELFAKDVNEWREEARHSHGETLCIFIDAYDSRKNDDRWLYGEHGLCRKLEHAIFVITGEKKLPWEKGDENRDKFWREEGSEGKSVADGKPHGALIYREIKKPDEKERKKFLEAGGVTSKDMKSALYYTDGWPELMDKWCKVFAPGDKSEALSDEQREKLAEWVKAFVEDHWHVEISDSVYLMAGMRRWTRDLLECAMWASGVGINDDIEDVMKELGVEGLITRESGGVYCMCNDSIRDILVRNTILDHPQRERAYWALIRENTASGAEAAYYLGEKDLWEEKLAKRLAYHARCLAKQLEYHARYPANPAKKQAQEPDGAAKNDYWKELEEEMQSEQQQEKQLALYKRIVDLLEKAIDVFDKVGNVKEKLFAMNKRSMYCLSLDRYDEAFALAKQVFEECKALEEREESKGWRWLKRTREYAQENMKDADAESGEP